MILAIALFYLPSLAVLVPVAWFISNRLYMRSETDVIRPRLGRTLVASGAVISAGIAFLALSWPPLGEMANALIAPFLVGLALLGIARGLRGVHLVASVVLNRLGAGALHGVWVLPVLGLLYFIIFVLRW